MPGKMFKIENYILRFDTTKQRPWIIVTYRDEGVEKHTDIYPPPESAVFVSDMLRNEKPVFWLPEEQLLTSSRERVGEEEGR